jgi:hypothetical protein
MQAPDDAPPPSRAPRPVLALPAPEALGIPRAAASPATAVVVASVDWNATHERLQKLGVLSVHVDRLSTGAHRVTFLLPTESAARTRHIESTAATEAAAVQLALEKAENFQP